MEELRAKRDEWGPGVMGEVRAVQAGWVSVQEVALRSVMEGTGGRFSGTWKETSLSEGSLSSMLVTLMVTVAVSEAEPSAYLKSLV